MVINEGIKPETRGELKLFFVAAFPIHVWSIISQLWQIGEGKEFLERAAYSLSFALLESITICFLLILVYLLMKRRWDADKAIVSISTLYFWVSLCAMINQIYFMLDKSKGTFLYRGFNYVGRHGIVFLSLMVLLIILTTWMLLTLALRSERFQRFIFSFIDRISVLTSLYLVCDIAGVVTVMIRNI